MSLGYEDDNYSDNGYNDHDDGTDDQCKTQGTSYGGPAAVTIMIFRGVPADAPTSHFDFDVVSTTNDQNGLPYNPLWTWQARPENAGGKPDTTTCHNFSVRHSFLDVPDEFMSPYLGDCTDQADQSGIDQPVGFNWTICSYGTKPYIGDVFPGHANWFPVTVEGSANWGNHSADLISDDDYDFNFFAEDGIEGLSINGRSGLHVEFDSDETIDNFTSDEWNQFHQSVDDWNLAKVQLSNCIKKSGSCSDQQLADIYARIQRVSTLWNGHTILTGMFGIDNEHEPKAELHPPYALATLRENFENDPSDEVWLMFVRNQGDEGFCSSAIWDSGLEDYTFTLPWHTGMTAVDVNWDKTQFIGTDGTSPPSVQATPGTGVYVTFHLGPPVPGHGIVGTPASVPFINGALHLVWSAGGGVKMSGPIQPGTTVQAKQGPVFQSKPVQQKPAPEKPAPEKPAVDAQGKAKTTTVVAAPRPTPAQTTATATTTPAKDDGGVDEVEQMIAAAASQLPPDKQKAIAAARVLPGIQAAVVHPLPPGGPVQIITQRPPVARVAKPHAIKAGPAIQKQARDDAQMKALCAASDNKPAGLTLPLCTANPAQAPAPPAAGEAPQPKPQP